MNFDETSIKQRLDQNIDFYSVFRTACNFTIPFYFQQPLIFSLLLDQAPGTHRISRIISCCFKLKFDIRGLSVYCLRYCKASCKRQHIRIRSKIFHFKVEKISNKKEINAECGNESDSSLKLLEQHTFLTSLYSTNLETFC